MVKKTKLELAHEMNDTSLWQIRKKLFISQAWISALFLKIIKHPIFETISLLVIITNSITLALDDPTQDQQSSFLSTLETIFLILYTIEMFCKIFGLGFFFNPGGLPARFMKHTRFCHCCVCVYADTHKFRIDEYLSAEIVSGSEATSRDLQH